nr:ribonuclease H-like domain-containing protein [Tanacetum cinerariifolium]
MEDMLLLVEIQMWVLVTKPHNKTPYELLLGRTPSIGFIRPFGCPVTILNTLDLLGSRPTWLFNIDTLTQSMNYQPVNTAAATTTASTITAAPMPTASAARTRKGIVIRDPEETATPSIIVHSEPKSKDKRKGIMVEEPKPLKKKAQIEQDKAYARELEAELNANINWNEELEEEASKHKRTSETFEEKAAKKQKLNEEVEELKTHPQIVPNDEDDVYTEATSLALKVSVVDYEIHTDHNKPYYKIIRADRTHQLFLSFINLLRNFDREDLEMLWQIVQERFASSKPKNFLDDYLLNTLKIMFEKPDVEAHMILLVERRYPLTRFSLDQMLNNVRLEVEEESEASLELLRFVRRQQQEGYRPDFGVDAIKDFKEYTLRDYYCWLKTYCCWYKLKLLEDAVKRS